jgi:hypothetical protein
MREFRECQPDVPIVLSFVAPESEELFYPLVRSLRLPISLWMYAVEMFWCIFSALHSALWQTLM